MKLTTDIQEAIDVLCSGGVIVYPTETSYGIGCDATNASAVARVFAVKHRPEGKGVTVLLPSNDLFGDRCVVWRSELRDLAKTHWPGALNIVAPIHPETSIASQCFTHRTLAVRRSSHAIASALADAIGVPIVSTSANISGDPELYSARDIFHRFSSEAIQPDCIFDAGVLPKRAPSTVVAWDNARGVVALRQGETVV